MLGQQRGNYKYTGTDYRFKHIAFDQQLIDRINEGLAFIENNQGTTHENIALNAKTNVSSKFGGSNYYDGSKLVDGDRATKWNTAFGQPAPHRVEIDLGSVHIISCYVVRHAGSNREPKKYNTRDFDLESSLDGSSWTIHDRVRDNTADITDRNLNTFTARYLKLYLIDAGKTYVHIYEVEVYEEPSVIISQGAVVEVSSAFPSSTNYYDDSKMVDGLDHTKWNSEDSQGPHWAIFDLGNTCNIYKYVIKHAGTREYLKYNTRSYTLETSDDKKIWTMVDEVIGNTASITENALTDASGCYLRLEITDAGEGYAWIYEFTAYGSGDCLL